MAEPTSATRHFPDFFAPQGDEVDTETAQRVVRDFLRSKDRGLGLDIADDAPFSAIDGGITNGLLRIDDREGKNGYLVRIFGKNTEQLIDREQDNRLVEFLALPTVAVAPKLYCVFGNGRVEEMLEAKALEPHHMHARGPPVDLLTAIADTVSKFHLLAPPGVSSECVLWRRLQGFFNQAKEAYPCPEKGKDKYIIDWAAIDKELEWLQTVLPSKKNDQGKALMTSASSASSSSYEAAASTAAASAMFRSAFCHNDLLSGNFLLDSKSPFWKANSAGTNAAAGSGGGEASPTSAQQPAVGVHLIDYEYADTNFVGFDLANHICEHAGFSCNFAPLGEGGDFPGRDVRKDIVAAYAFHACERAAARLCSGVKGAPQIALEDRGEDLEACKAVLLTAAAATSSSSSSSSSGAGEVGATAADVAVASPTAIAREARCRCREDKGMIDCMTDWVEKFCLASHFWWGLWAFVQARNSAIDFDFEGYAIKRLKGYSLHKEVFFVIKGSGSGNEEGGEALLWREK